MAYGRLFVGYGQTVYVLLNLYIAVCCKQFHRMLHPHHQLSGISSTDWKSVSEGGACMPSLASNICLAAGACALIVAAPIGSVALSQSAASNLGPFSTSATVTETTPSTVEGTPMAVPGIKGPAALPSEEQGLP
jgi:hypothetical protein